MDRVKSRGYNSDPIMVVTERFRLKIYPVDRVIDPEQMDNVLMC